MKAASREALATSQTRLDEILGGDNNVATAAQAGLDIFEVVDVLDADRELPVAFTDICLLYTSPSPRDLSTSRMPSSA